VAPEPEHQKLLAVAHPTPVQQAQLLIWEACQAGAYKRRASTTERCEFSSGESLPVRAQWEFDRNCLHMSVRVAWDPKIRTTNDVHVAVARVINQGFWQNLDTFYFVHGALERGSAKQTLRPVNSAAVFYCQAHRVSPTELVLEAHVLPE
jgi:hypothetical protein